MADVFNVIWSGVERFNLFLHSPAGIKLLNIAFISSAFFLFLLSLSFLLRQEFLILLSTILSLSAGGIIYLLSLSSSPLPDQYSIIDKFLIITGAKRVSDPEMHLTIGTGDNRDNAFISALDSAFSTALGAGIDGLFKNLISRDFKGFEAKFKTFFEISKEKIEPEKEIVEVKWNLPRVRTFILRNGFSPTPSILVLELTKNPSSIPSQTVVDQISVLYKAKSMYFKNGVFYATCDAILRELKKGVFKTSAGELSIETLSYEEKMDAQNNRICNIKIESLRLTHGG